MILVFIIFIIGLILLVKGAEVAVRGAEGLAFRLGVSAATIGLTVVAFGTSLPEFFVSTEAFYTANYGIGLANITGSNIVNIAFILAICVLINPSVTSIPELRPRFLKDSVLMLTATLLYVIFSIRGVLDWISGIAFLVFFSGILYFIRKNSREESTQQCVLVKYPMLQTIAGLGAVIVGSHLLLSAAVDIGAFFNIPQYVIGLSIIAIGTSLPELATSLIAALKKSPAISVGNIIGSNIFNLLFILGTNSLFTTIPVAEYTDALVMTGFSIGIFGFYTGSRWHIRLWALVLIAGYCIFIGIIYGLI